MNELTSTQTKSRRIKDELWILAGAMLAYALIDLYGDPLNELATPSGALYVLIVLAPLVNAIVASFGQKVCSFYLRYSLSMLSFATFLYFINSIGIEKVFRKLGSMPEMIGIIGTIVLVQVGLYFAMMKDRKENE